MKLKSIFLLALFTTLVMLTSCMSTQYQPSEEEKALVGAVLTKNTAGVETMLQNGISPDARAVSGCTALTTAINNSDLDMAGLLLSYGADINMTDNDGNTSLFYAKKPKIQQWLIEKGIDIQIVSKKERTAFEMWCTESATVLSNGQKKEYMDILKSQKIPITKDQMEELFWVSKDDIIQTIKLFTAAGYDLNATHNSGGDSVLMLTSRLDNYLLMEELLKGGADAQIDNKIGDDALNIIASNPESKHTNAEYKTIVTALLAHGAEINGPDSYGNTPLCNAAIINHQSRVLILLSMKDCGINVPGEFGSTALFKTNSFAIVKDLVAAGADIDFENNGGSTPLFMQLNVDSVKYLIKLGADVNHINNYDKTILIHNMLSANKGYTTNNDYDGIINQYIGKFEALVAAGIDVNHEEEKYGFTALGLARRVPFVEFVSLFEKAGAR
ncbi:MAG: ankyrin repeat domain-containing protein [Spirochaetales bacterium]|nr:ankyrin repeat domain-containing protein [Spirochaetales bacterium]